MSSVPNRSGSATTSSTGTPSTVIPIARRSDRSTTETICGSGSKRSSAAPALRSRRPRTPRSSRAGAAGRRRSLHRAPRQRCRSARAPGSGACLAADEADPPAPARRAASPRSSARLPGRSSAVPPQRPRGTRRPSALRARARSRPPASARSRAAARARPAPARPRSPARRAPRSAPSRRAPSAAPRSPARSRAARARARRGRDRRPAPSSRGSSRPRAGTPATCTGSTREVEERRERLEPVRDLRVRGAVLGGHGQ